MPPVMMGWQHIRKDPIWPGARLNNDAGLLLSWLQDETTLLFDYH